MTKLNRQGTGIVSDITALGVAVALAGFWIAGGFMMSRIPPSHPASSQRPQAAPSVPAAASPKPGQG